MADEKRKRAHIEEAAAIVSAQAECSRHEAIALLTLRAETLGLTLHDAALDVIDGRINFRIDSSGGSSGGV